ncbi:MAG: hypothetical protein R3278_10460 [Lysobacter spongiicola]|nr:hypothetical protein [Lysobacter spongiicola]
MLRGQAPARAPAAHTALPSPAGSGHPREEHPMSKGLDRKKEQKKKPAKTMKEKRSEKNEKKVNKPFAPV